MFSNKNSHNWRHPALPPRLRLMPLFAIPRPRILFLPRALLAAGFLLAANALPATAQKPADDDAGQKRCLGEMAANADQRIAACTGLINKSGAARDDLLAWFVARGDA